MDDEDDFFDTLLAHIEEQRLIPIVGPAILAVPWRGQVVPLYRAVACQLLEYYGRTSIGEGETTTDPDAVVLRAGRELSDAVGAVLGDRRRDPYSAVPRALAAVLKETQDAALAPLRALASIEAFRLYVTTSIDDLLLRAIDEVRHGGLEKTRQILHVPNLPTDEFRDITDADQASSQFTAVLSLFGRARNAQLYAVHDEDMLEYVHNLQTRGSNVPERFVAKLRDSDLLLIGCSLPEWMSRFFLRLSSPNRLGDDRRAKREFLVCSEGEGREGLVVFLEQFSRQSNVFRCDPQRFVMELARRWRERHPLASSTSTVVSPIPSGARPTAVDDAVFISYTRADVAAAQRLRRDLHGVGIDAVWFDHAALRPGDDWSREIANGIRRCHLFLPLISAHTEARTDGYFHVEWDLATKRAAEILGPDVYRPDRDRRRVYRERWRLHAGAGDIPAEAFRPCARRHDERSAARPPRRTDSRVSPHEGCMSAEAAVTDTATIASPRTADAQNPWPGLDSFDENAADFFKGRDDERTELLRLISQSPLTVLFGKSGLGKTSILKAGLFPRLRERDIFPVYVRLAVLEREGRLVDQLTAALVKEVSTHKIQLEPDGLAGPLWERLHHRDFVLWSPQNRPLTPLFVLDQFEEVFTLGAANADAIERLRVDLADLVENRIPAALVERLESTAEPDAAIDVARQRYKVLLAFREDFLPDIEAWRSRIPSLTRNRFRLRAMSAAQGFAAVYETGRTAKLVDDPTAREIVRFVGKIQSDDRNASTTTRSQSSEADADTDVLTRYEIEPALLSLVCAELNKRRQTANPPRAAIDAELLRGAGGSIIADFYRRHVQTVPLKTRQFIEEELLTEGGYRSSFPVDEALRQGSLTTEVLRQLVNGRLLRIEQQLGVSRVELTHDRLTDVVALERDARRATERTAGRRRRLMTYGISAGVLAALVLIASFMLVAKLASDRQRDEADAQRAAAVKATDEAKVQLQIANEEKRRADEATRQAQTERDEANRLRKIAEDARAAIVAEQQRTEEQRALAEARELQAREAEAKATASAAEARRQNAVVGELYAPMRPSVLRLGTRDFVSATGFMVTRTGLAITAAHVVQSFGTRPLVARTYDNRQFSVSIVKLDAARDLALLRLPEFANSPCLALRSTSVEIGTSVVALSIAQSQEWVATAGKVIARNVSLGRKLAMEGVRFADGDLIETDLYTEGGFSGAPVMDPYARRVVGIGAYGNNNPTPRHYLIPAARITATFAAELGETPCPGS